LDKVVYGKGYPPVVRRGAARFRPPSEEGCPTPYIERPPALETSSGAEPHLLHEASPQPSYTPDHLDAWGQKVTRQPANSTCRLPPDPAPKRLQLGGTPFPYPSPASPTSSAIAHGNKRRDTRPELSLRSELHRGGLRYRVGYVVEVADVRVSVDVAFTRARLA